MLPGLRVLTLSNLNAWQRDPNRCAFAKIAFDAQPTAMQFDQKLRQRQTKACACTFLDPRRMQLRKTGKRAGNVVRAHADTIILYGKAEFIAQYR